MNAYGAANPNVDITPLDPANLVFDASATHRVVIEFFGNARGTGSGSHANTPTGAAGNGTAEILRPLNVIYDFVPSAPATPVKASVSSREIVTLATCDNCHTVLLYHGNHRTDPQNCVTCHTDQRRYGTVPSTRDAAGNITGPLNAKGAVISANINGTSELEFDQMIHQIHMGSALLATGHDLSADKSGPITNVNFPQNAANCVSCHATVTAGTTVLNPQAGNWAVKPSRAACGGCHDNVNFLTGDNHEGYTELNDSACITCHDADHITVAHTPLMSPTENGTSAPSRSGAPGTFNWTATSHDNLPAGAATVSYKIVSATINTTGNPVLQFQIIINGQAVDLNTFDPASIVDSEPLPTGFAAGPNIAVLMAIPQDGITPTDFNYGHDDSASWNLRQLWNMTAKTKGGVLVTTTGIVAGAAAHTWQVTMDGLVVPPTTNMVSMGIGFSGIVQTNLTADAILKFRPGGTPDFTWTKATAPNLQGTGGVLLPAQGIWANATGTVPGSANKLVARRTIIDPAACSTCHANLGNFTTNGVSADTNFHANQDQRWFGLYLLPLHPRQQPRLVLQRQDLGSRPACWRSAGTTLQHHDQLPRHHLPWGAERL